VNLYAVESIEITKIKKIDIKKNDFNNTNNEKNVGEKDQALVNFLSTLRIEQGIANFIQKKHFTFLNNPIVSKGLLKIHQNSIIWQTNTPVFSKLVIIEDQVWQLTNQGDKQHNNKNQLPEQYQIVASHASIETLIRAVLTGRINPTQWTMSLNDQQCVKLAPKDLILSQTIKYIIVCTPNNNNQRFVTLTDAQNNLTEIELNIITNQLSDEDIREFNIQK
jgi:hypothetical protein